MATNRRVSRVAAQIQREVSQLLQNGIKDDRVGASMVSVTDVDVSGDLQHAKIFVSLYGTSEAKAETMAALKESTSFVRKELGARVRLRRTPEVVFVEDRSLERGDRILSLINQLSSNRRDDDELEENDTEYDTVSAEEEEKSLNFSKLPDLNTLSLEQQVAQMVVVRASGYLFDHQIQYPVWEPTAAKLRHWLENLGVGGVILLGGSAGELALRSQQLQNWSKIPLLIAADIEEGVGQRFSGATWFPPPMILSPIGDKNPAQAQQYAQQMGAITAAEALAIGINWVLAPVVDVNNNPNNPVINVRAFGETPADVSRLATAFIEGAKKYPVLTTAKHFPGHGDTAVDSHLELPVLPHTPERLAEIELPPFKTAIEAGVDAVMSAHLLIPAWDAEKPATLSEKILTQQLRENLSFNGLIVTDALVMGAIANRYGVTEAPVLAVEAGADILLMPVDPEAAIAAVCDAVRTGRISPERIRASVERIWQAKHKLGYGDSSPLLTQIAKPEAIATVTNILRDSTEIFGSVPLDLAKESGNLRNLIVVDSLLESQFLCRTAPAIAIPERLGYKTQLVDCHTPSMSVCGGEETFSSTVLQLFIRGNPFRGSAGLTQVAQDWFKRLLKTGELQALVVYGSPYVKKQFLAALPSSIPCILSYGQMHQAQAIALEILFGNAHLVER